VDRKELAVRRFNEELNCCQAVVSAFCGEYGFDENTALRLAVGFGGGMGNVQDVCGAVTGGIMALGLICGGSFFDKRRVYEKSALFISEFNKENKSIRCLDLTGCDFSRPEGRKKYIVENVQANICSKCIRDSVIIIERLLKSR